MEALRVVANKDISKVVVRGIPDRPGIAAEIFGSLGAQGFNVELVVATGGRQDTADICLAVSLDQRSEVVRALEEMKDTTMGSEIVVDADAALVSVVGPNLSRVPGVAGRMFKALSSKGVNIEIISTSLASVTCLIPREKTEEAVAALEGEFLNERAHN